MQPFYPFRITFYYYSTISLVVTVVVGLIVSYFTDSGKMRVNPELLSPFVRPVRRKGVRSDAPPEYESVEEASNLVLNKKSGSDQEDYVL